MRKLPIGIQDFVRLREDGYVYVDKTEAIFGLVSTGSAYFLARPRRFGKSLLVSTLGALFEGRRDLFEGLWIAKAHEGVEPWSFQAGPVVRLDLSAKEYGQGRAWLVDHLDTQLENNARRLGLSLHGNEPVARFARLLADAHELSGVRAVVLVDEYDKPLLETLERPGLHREMRALLKAFYSVLKSSDEHLRFTLLTGVSKFGQVSIFSDLNHLRDISLSLDYAQLCGITQPELEHEFSPELDQVVAALTGPHESAAQARQRTLSELKLWYNGYRFHESAAAVYNPFSTLSFFAERKFAGYWFQTGTPTFLLQLLERNPMPLQDLEGANVPASAFSEIDPERPQALPVLFQSGYLTIRDYLPSISSYCLGYPNREVKQGLMEHLVDRFASVEPAERGGRLADLVLSVRDGRVDDFMRHLQVFFANIPYDLHIPREKYYQTICYLVFRLIGFNIQAEVKHAAGRTDAVVETADHVYLFEFKLDRASAEEALLQIDERGYALPYVGGTKQLVKIGVSFDSELRNIDRWVVG